METMDYRIMDDAVTSVEPTLATTSAPHGYGYGHYISYYGHYSYILLILMGITVLLGSLLVAYVKKIDSGILRRSAQRERGRGNRRGSAGDSDSESEDLKKDLPPEYRLALEMPRPDIEDYSRFFEYTLVHSSNSVTEASQSQEEATTEEPNLEQEEETPEVRPEVRPEVPPNSENVLTMVDETCNQNENLPTYDEYIQSMSDMEQV